VDTGHHRRILADQPDVPQQRPLHIEVAAPVGGEGIGEIS
jgi:hypothetical protein